MKSRILSLVTLLATILLPTVALAADGGGGGVTNDGYFAIAMVVGVGIAALGGGLGQGRAAAAALEGIARNPAAADKVFTPMLLGLAFVESLVIFTFVTAFLVYGWHG